MGTPNWSDLSSSVVDEGSVLLMDRSASHLNLLDPAYRRGVSLEAQYSARVMDSTRDSNQLTTMQIVSRNLKQCEFGAKPFHMADTSLVFSGGPNPSEKGVSV